MNPERIGQMIKDIRKKNHLTQKQFADKYGVTYQAVSKWENGKNIPDIVLLREIGKDFEIPMEDLLDGKTSTTPKKSFVKKYKNLSLKPFLRIVINLNFQEVLPITRINLQFIFHISNIVAKKIQPCINT